MKRTAAPLGEGRLGCFIWLGILLLASLIAYKAIPVKLASTQLYDYMDDQARFGARVPTQTLRDRVLRRAKELDVPLTAKNLTVKKTGGLIRMECSYTAPVNILGFTYNWDFDLQVERQVFIF